MRKQNSGFTLIELVAVIVILGALAVVALPRFINLQDEAQEAALQGVVGGLASASAVNLAGALAGDSSAVNITTCGQVASAMQGGVPDGYAIDGGAPSAATPGTGLEFTCNVARDTSGATSASFNAYYVSNAP